MISWRLADGKSWGICFSERGDGSLKRSWILPCGGKLLVHTLHRNGNPRNVSQLKYSSVTLGLRNWRYDEFPNEKCTWLFTAQIKVVKAKTPRRRTKPALMRKINLTYSFDKLRLRRNKEKMTTVSAISSKIPRPQHNAIYHVNATLLQETDSRTDSPDEANSSADVKENEVRQDEKTDVNPDGIESTAARQSREDSINMDALFAHRILYKYQAPENKRHKKIRLPSINGQNGSTTTETITSDSDNTTYGSNSPSDITFVGNIRPWKNSFKKSKSIREVYFLHDTPENFVEMCIAGLSEYIIRLEGVLTGVGFKRVESLTVNRIPLCKYGESDH